MEQIMIGPARRRPRTLHTLENTQNYEFTRGETVSGSIRKIQKTPEEWESKMARKAGNPPLFSAFCGIQSCKLIHQVLHHGFGPDVGSCSDRWWARNGSVYRRSSRSYADWYEGSASRFKSGGNFPKSIALPPFFLL